VTLLLVRKINPKLERIVASFANLQNQSPIDTMAGKNQRIIIIIKKRGGWRGGRRGKKRTKKETRARLSSVAPPGPWICQRNEVLVPNSFCS